MNLIALSVPVFLALIFIETLADRDAYELSDSVANLGCGVLSQVASIVTAGLVAVAFGGLYEVLGRFAPVPLHGAAAWVVAVCAVDLAYYWWHRASHQINFLWAMHVVHHQSARYNLTVALRQASFSVVISWIVYVPIALLGVPFKITLAVTALDTLYQFWIHTERIKRLGPLEAFMNTPSHHRVHHGVNARYIDKNYAGIFISWDKLFGSFEPETEKVVYGITTGFPSRSAGWANLHYWLELAELSRRASSLREKLKVWLMYPGWRPAGVGKLPPPEAAEASTGAKRLAFILLAAGIILLMVLYRIPGPWTRVMLWGTAVAATILAADWTLSREVESRPLPDA